MAEPEPELHQWEVVFRDDLTHDWTRRMRVPGGWLYLHETATPQGLALTSVFVPAQHSGDKPALKMGTGLIQGIPF